MKWVLPALCCLSSYSYAQVATVEHVPRQPYNKYSFQSDNCNTIFYLSEFDKNSRLPLIIYVQGSGHNSLFTKDNNGAVTPRSGHIMLTYAAKQKARVLIVEKPGVQYLENVIDNPDFDSLFSLQSWSYNIIKALGYTIKNELIDTSRILVIGHSEGGLVAATVAGNPTHKISHTAILAGEGPSQLYSLYNFACDSIFFTANGKIKQQRIDSLLQAWEKICADPVAVNKKFWGLTYKRWSTFLQTSVIDQLSAYNGKIRIVQGSNDKNVYPESATILYTSLASKGKSAELYIIPDADHSFKSAQKDYWEDVLKDCVNWFLK